VVDPLGHQAAGLAVEPQRQGDVVGHLEQRVQVVALQHHPDPAPPPGPLHRGQAGEILTIDDHRPAAGLQEAGEHVHSMLWQARPVVAELRRPWPTRLVFLMRRFSASGVCL
jgi:hypothetical protein